MPTRFALALSVAAALTLAACGGSSSSSTSSASSASASPSATSTTAASATSTSSAAAKKVGGAGGSSLTVAADPSGALKFNQATLQAHAGAVSIAFANQAPVPHNLTITGPGGQPVAATPTFQGGTKTLTAHLKPGTYTFFCSVPGHRAAGMQGTLTVT